MKPILFSTPMVQAILQGRKTMTRRIIKDSYNGCWTNGGPHPCPNEPIVMIPGEVIESPIEGEEPIVIEGNKVQAHFFCSTMDKVAKCSFGKPDDVLWVRETFSWDWKNYPERTDKYYYYKATTDDYYLASGEKWKPSIFMPKEACRIWLKIKTVRVERLHDISEEDAIAEGVETLGLYPGYNVSSMGKFNGLWVNINGTESWDANPWVWVIEFERTSKP